MGSNKSSENKKLGQPKEWTVHETEWAKLTKWIEITVKELRDILKEEMKEHRSVDEEEICPICRCELYDDILKMSDEEIDKLDQEQLKDPSQITVIKFSGCMDHFYHKDWAEAFLSHKTYIKWAVWGKIYGENIGEMPPGRMTWDFNKAGNLPLSTYESYGTWVINYSFYDGLKKDGTKYKGTLRTAFLPDTQEGREVLVLLIKCFRRRHTFVVGDSVTTGAKNVVVWNSIHHKTHTHGGSAYFGYPDETYFNRVKLEMADKGVVLEESDDTSSLQSGRILIKK